MNTGNAGRVSPLQKDRHFDFQPDKQFAAERASLMFLQDLLKALPAIATVSPMNNKATASFFAVRSDQATPRDDRRHTPA